MYFEPLSNEYSATVADLRRFLQQVVKDLPQPYGFQADFVVGIAGSGKDTLVNHGRVVTGLTDPCLGRALKLKCLSS